MSGPRPAAVRGGPVGLPVLGAVAVGGALGALGRYGLTLWWPGAEGGLPLSMFAVNAGGCALIGVLMVLLTEGPGRGSGGVRPLLRPFLGVGVLGGFTSFSAYAADTVRLLEESAYGPAAAYGLGTVAVALAAVAGGAGLTRAALRGGGTGRRGGAVRRR